MTAVCMRALDTLAGVQHARRAAHTAYQRRLYRRSGHAMTVEEAREACSRVIADAESNWRRESG